MGAAKPELSRRDFLSGAGYAGLSLVAGCCASAPSISNRALSLEAGLLAEDQSAAIGTSGIPAIDAHAHFFNASDLQAAGYLAGPIANDVPDALRRLIELLVPVVEAMARDFAPSAFDEMNHLQSLDADLAGLSQSDRLQRLDESIIRRKNEIAEELFRRLEKTDFPDAFRSSLQNGNYLIRGQQEFSEESVRAALDYGIGQENLFGSTAAFSGPGDDHPAGILAFVGNMFHYRIENIRIYQKGYTAPARSVRVVAACHALVDFDFWLSGCDHPPSRLHDQVLLTEKLVEVTNGFILPLFAYNPASDLKSGGESLALLEEAVAHRGFIGAKIYPPICFQPLGAGADPMQDGWPTPAELKPVLSRFYRKCLELDIPVMAHTNHSMGAIPACRANPSPDNWSTLLGNPEFGRLRVNAGHFGGIHDPGEPGHGWSAGFTGLMRTAPHFYADIGFWDEVAAGDAAAVSQLFEMLSTDIGQGRTAARRILFGTDWFMLARKRIWPFYADNIHQQMKTAGLGAEDLSRLMYTNVLDLYGLKKSVPGQNRSRLLRYYGDRSLSPDWLSLVPEDIF